MIYQRKTVTSKYSDKNPITVFSIEVPHLQILDDSVCQHLIQMHLHKPLLEGRWLAVKHDCSRPHLHVAPTTETSNPEQT
jgi:hypothetical protein